MTRPRLPAASRALAVLGTAALLSGCASLSPDGALGPVQQTAQQRLGTTLLPARNPAEQDAISARVVSLLARPLDMDAAVQVALLNNRGLQAAIQGLGITEAEVVQAGRLPNPGISLGRVTRGGEVEIERGLHFGLARLLTLPLAAEAGRQRLAQAQGALAMVVLQLAADTRKAWVLALAAEEGLRYQQQVGQAAEASAELANRMAAVGNFNALQRAREQGFHADALLNLARAEQVQRASRERLVRLLGLWGAQTQFSLPPRLPDLPATLAEQGDIEALAIAQRLDVHGARLALAQTARNLGYARPTSFVNGLELGLARNSSNEAPIQRGVEIAFELPLFDWGTARVARAQATYLQALHQAAQTAIDARSEVREAWTAWRSAHAIARHHAERIVPLRQRIADENLLRYNGMLIGVFELLADARLQISSVNAAIEAKRDFWLAQADLDMALVGKPSLSPATGPAPMADAAPGGH